MVIKVAKKPSMRPLLYLLAPLLALVILITVACGVKAGENRPARPQGQAEEFHRTTVAAFEQFRIDISKTDEGCTADPADVSVTASQRIRLAVQLTTEAITQGTTGSIVLTGERDQVTYEIPELEITAAAGALSAGVRKIDFILEEGARKSYDFNLASTGTFDILCDGEKVGTFTVAEEG